MRQITTQKNSEKKGIGEKNPPRRGIEPRSPA